MYYNLQRNVRITHAFFVVSQSIPIFPKVPKIAGFRLIFDLSIFIVVTAIGLNMILGIIVDAFGELRMERVRKYVAIRWLLHVLGLPVDRNSICLLRESMSESG